MVEQKKTLNDILQKKEIMDYRCFNDLQIYQRLENEDDICLNLGDVSTIKLETNIMGFVFCTDYKKNNLSELILILKTEEKTKTDRLAQQYSDSFDFKITDEYKNFYRLVITCFNYAGLQELAQELLSIFLITGRPVIGYNSTFYLPLDINHSDAQGKLYAEKNWLDINKDNTQYKDFILKNSSRADDCKEHQQAYLYFNNEVRGYLYKTDKIDKADKNNEVIPIAEYTLDIAEQDNAVWQIKVEKDDIDIIAQLHKVSLLKYYNGLFLLAIEVRLPDELNHFATTTLEENESDWWWTILTTNYHKLLQLQVCHWLDFTYYNRIIYPSFHEQDIEYKFKPLSLIKKQYINNSHWEKIISRYNLTHTGQGIQLGEEKNSIVLYFLTQFFKESDIDIKARLCHLDDDRQFCNTVYTLAGQHSQNTLAKEQYRRLFSLMLYIDRSKDTSPAMLDFAYDKEFVAKQMVQSTYTRWEGLGTLSGYTNYSNIYCGFGSYHKNVIANTHISFIYGRMLSLCLFYKMTLKMHSRNIATLGDNIKNYSKIAKNILRFTNRYYFQDVTNQIQGQEIFEKQIKALKIKEEFEFIKEETLWSDEYYDKKENNKQNTKLFILTIAAGIISLITLKDLPEFIGFVEKVRDYIFHLIYTFSLADFL